MPTLGSLATSLGETPGRHPMRTESRLYTRIWDDDRDWLALTFAAQWTYMMLISQQDLEHHGGIALRIPRWSHLADDMTEPLLTQAIDELAEHRFVVIDHDYGELFIRALVRQDRVYKQPNVLRSACDRLGQVRSPAILAAMHTELQRVHGLPDLTENCRLIVTEMLDATEPGAPRPTIRRTRHRPGKATHPSDEPSPAGSANPSATATTNPFGNGSPGPSRNRGSKPSAKTAATGQPQPPTKPSVNPASDSAQARAATSAETTDNPSPYPQPTASGNRSTNPSHAPAGHPRTADQPQSAPHPSTVPHSDIDTRPPAAHRRILAGWLRSTGDQVLPAGLISTVERVLADSLRAGEPAERVADVLGRWQHEDGTDTARLKTMIANAADPPPAADSELAADDISTATSTRQAAPQRLGGWEVDALAAATAAITHPWLATLTEQPSNDTFDDIEYHVSRALIEGHPPDHVAACLAAWHASGNTDTWQLTDLIDGAGMLSRPQDATATVAASAPSTVNAVPPSASADDAPPTSAEEWLATAKANP